MRNLLIDDAEQGIFRVNRGVFLDDAVLAAERREIFDRAWLYALHESELPGPNSYITRKVAGRPIIFSRDKDGKLHAMFNACSHRGAAICREKAGTAKRFTCNYHAWTFDITGKLLVIPGAEGYSPAAGDRSKLGLAHVPRLDSYRGMVFICFDKDAQSLHDFLAGARDVIDFFLAVCGDDVEVPAGGQEYGMNANWKLMVENSFDGYHVASMHQRYFRQHLPDMGINLPIGGGPPGPIGMGVSLGNGHSAVLTPPLPSPLANSADTLREVQARLAATHGPKAGLMESSNLFLYPNTILITMWRSIRTFHPVSTNYAEINAWGLMPRGEPVEMRHRRLDNYNSFLGPAGFGTPDDLVALQSSQHGFAAYAHEPEWSDLSRGMHWEDPGMNEEAQMRAFWRRWHHAVQGRSGDVECADRPVSAVSAKAAQGNVR